MFDIALDIRIHMRLVFVRLGGQPPGKEAVWETKEATLSASSRRSRGSRAPGPVHGSVGSPPGAGGRVRDGNEDSYEERFYGALYAAASWVAVVRMLHYDLGLSKSELARGASVDPVTVSRWLESSDDTEIRAKRGLNELRYVILTLLGHGGMSLRLLRFWLTSLDVVLGTDALTAISQGRFEDVVEAGKDVSRLRKAAESRPPDDTASFHEAPPSGELPELTNGKGPAPLSESGNERSKNGGHRRHRSGRT